MSLHDFFSESLFPVCLKKNYFYICLYAFQIENHATNLSEWVHSKYIVRTAITTHMQVTDIKSPNHFTTFNLLEISLRRKLVPQLR